MEPDRRRSAVAVHSSSSDEDLGGPLGGPIIYEPRPRKLLKRKGKAINLPRPVKHQRLEGVETEPTELPSSDDEPETSFNLERKRGNILKSSFDV